MASKVRDLLLPIAGLLSTRNHVHIACRPGRVQLPSHNALAISLSGVPLASRPAPLRRQ
jgi:hypothetical protein